MFIALLLKVSIFSPKYTWHLNNMGVRGTNSCTVENPVWFWLLQSPSHPEDSPPIPKCTGAQAPVENGVEWCTQSALCTCRLHCCLETVQVFMGKNPHKSGCLLFKPMFFNGQLYCQNSLYLVFEIWEVVYEVFSNLFSIA